MRPSSEDKVTLILDAAFQLFGTKGFYETTMAEIAEKIGIAKGTVYLYFSSKEKLFVAVSERDFAAFLTVLHNKLLACRNLSEQLQAIANHHLTYYYERKAYTRIFFQAPNNDPDLMKAMKTFLENYMQAVATVMEEGGLDQPKLLAKSLVGLLDTVKMDIFFTPFTLDDVQYRADFAVKLFEHGCSSFN